MTEMSLIADLYIARADVFLALAALALLVIGVAIKKQAMPIVAGLGVGALVAVMTMVLQQDNGDQPVTLLGDMLIYDRFGVFMKCLVGLGGIAAIIMGARDLYGHVIARFEYVILVLLATLGMNLMISSNNMLTLYVGLELQSLALYILAAFNRNSLVSSEAGLKYFILGALSSGILLFGISLVYGFSGTTSFPLIAQTLAEQGVENIMPMVVGLVFVMVGLAFKISAVPFHMWTPDVYQGSPSCVTAFFAMAPKVAALALFIRVLFSAFGGLYDDWVQILYALSLASMVVGAVAGLVQTNIYRLLAYSSIGHMGYILLGLIAGNVEGMSASLIYISIYLVMTAGTFAMILAVRNKENIAAVNLSDFAGLSRKSPILAYGLAVMMFSMAGIPPMAGFMGKLFVFKAILSAGHITLAVIGVITSVVAAYYYLRLIKIMFFDQPSSADHYQVRESYVLRWITVPAFVFVIAYIAMPDRLVYEAIQAAASLY